MTTTTYTSPDARKPWHSAVDAVIDIGLLLVALLASFRNDWGQAMFLLALVALNQLAEIVREVRATRRLAEIELFAASWSKS